MVILLERGAAAFDPEIFPEWFWVSSLFGRATHNLVLSDELKHAYADRRARAQGGRRHSALALAPGPAQDPQPRAGGVLSDIAVGRRRLLRLLPASRWTVGDPGRGCQRSWHTRGRHDGDHAQPGPQPARAGRSAGRAVGACQPAALPALHGLQRGVRHGVLRRLRPCGRARSPIPPPATTRRESSVAATDRCTRSKRSAGRRWACSTSSSTNRRRWRSSPATSWRFTPTESPKPWTPNSVQFGVERLDEVLRRCGLDAREIIPAVIEAVDQFTGGQPPEDDRTLLVAQVS